MSRKNTLVLDEMPSLFWEIVKDNNSQDYFTEDNLLFSEDIEIIILRTKSTITESYYKRFPNLKCVIRAGSGYDNIDVEKAKDYNIIVQNTPDANVNSAFEHTIGLLFSLIKNHKEHNHNVLENKWRDKATNNLEITDLKVLVVGFGRVGSLVGNFLNSMGAKVKYVDPYLDANNINKDIQAISYEEGLSWANVITFHCPLYKETRNYFAASSLDFINKAYLLNVARGGIIDVDSAIAGLNKGKILGLAMDVMEEEPWQCEGWEDNKKIIMTPHTGAYTEKAKARLAKDTYSTWSAFNFEKIVKHQIKIW